MVVQADWTPFALGEDRAAAYKRDGAVLVPQVFNAAEIEKIRKTFTDQVESEYGKESKLSQDDGVPDDDVLKKYPRFVHPHRHPETEAGRMAREYLIDERVVGLATELVGPIHGAQTMFYFKPPMARGQAPHQDNWYLRAYPETCLAAWVAIDDADYENGGLVIVPRSHHNEILCHVDADPTLSFSKSRVKLPPGLDFYHTEMKAGDVLFFHGSTVHGSHHNRTKDRFRRALIFHYVPQASKEIAKNYLPLVSTATGEDLRINEAPTGGECGEGWTAAEVH